MSHCNARPFEKGVKPKSPRGSDLVVCPASKVHTTARGEHKKGWVCSSLRGTSPRPTPTKGWSHLADAMKQNLLALNRSTVMDPLPREAGGMPPVFYQSHLVPSTAALPTDHSEKGSLSQSRSGTRDVAG